MVSLENFPVAAQYREESDEVFLYRHLTPWAQDHARKSGGTIGTIPYMPSRYPFQRIEESFTPAAQIKGEHFIPDWIIRREIEKGYYTFFGDDRVAADLVRQFTKNKAFDDGSTTVIQALDELSEEGKKGTRGSSVLLVTAHDILHDLVLAPIARDLASKLRIERERNRVTISKTMTLETAIGKKREIPMAEVIPKAAGIHWVIPATLSAVSRGFDPARADEPEVARLLKIQEAINFPAMRGIIESARHGAKHALAVTGSGTERKYPDMVGIPPITNEAASLMTRFDYILPVAITKESDGAMNASLGKLYKIEKRPDASRLGEYVLDLLTEQLRESSKKCVYRTT